MTPLGSEQTTSLLVVLIALNWVEACPVSPLYPTRTQRPRYPFLQTQTNLVLKFPLRSSNRNFRFAYYKSMQEATKHLTIISKLFA